MKLQITWEEFKDAALSSLRQKYADAQNPVFMKTNGYEPDGEVWCMPEYVIIELREAATTGKGEQG